MIFIAAISMLLIQCANPVSPEGGAKDIISPRLLEADPPLRTVHFNSKSIKLTFDEFFSIKDQTKQIIISPPALPDAEFKVKGKSIIIDLKNELLPNTTYTINFGESIQDLAENNILKDFKYVFSTSGYIDSLQLEGKVTNAFDETTIKDVFAMLYLNNNDTIPFDSLPFKVKPYYITRTGDDGSFSFSNLIDQPLLLFALEDKNGNAIYDMPGERIAFCDSLATGFYMPPADTSHSDSLTADSTAVKDTTKAVPASGPDTLIKGTVFHTVYALRMFEENDTVQKLLKSERGKEGQIALYFRKPLEQPEINFFEFPDSVMAITEYSPARDTVYLWLTKHQNDTLRLSVTEHGLVLDTVEFPAPKVKKAAKDAKTPRLAVVSNIQNGYLNQYRNDPVYTVSYPLTNADLARIMIGDDKDTVQASASFADSTHRRIKISNKWKEETRYRIIIPDSILYAANDLTNDSIVSGFMTRSLRELGSLAVDVKTTLQTPDFIFQLLNEKEIVIEERKTSTPGKMIFTHLSPMNYKVKVIIDRNNNGKWDSGRYIKKLQPEQVYYYPGTIEVRANWDVEEKWEF